MYDIKNCFLFAELTDSEREALISLLNEPVVFHKGDTIYSEDKYQNALGVLLEGSAAAYSGRVIKRKFAEGDTFGAAAVFGNEARYISKITADRKCTIQFIDEATLCRWFSLNDKIAVNYISFLSDKIRYLNQKISHLSGNSAEDKLLCYLKANAKDGKAAVQSMSFLAKATGMGRTSLYRALENLEDSGSIKRNKNIIKVI